MDRIKSALDDSLKLLTKTSQMLDEQTDKIIEDKAIASDPAELKELKERLSSAIKAWQHVQEIRIKAGLVDPHAAGTLDLEAARNEILGRLDRLATRGEAQSVSE